MKAMSETIQSMATEPAVAGAESTLRKVRGRRRFNLWQFGTMGGAIAMAVFAIMFFRGGPSGDFATESASSGRSSRNSGRSPSPSPPTTRSQLAGDALTFGSSAGPLAEVRFKDQQAPYQRKPNVSACVA